MNSILNLIKANRDEAGFINLNNHELATRLGNDLDKNASLYRIIALDNNVRAIRLAGGGEVTTDFHHEELNRPPMSEEFLVERDQFRQWYCEYVVKYTRPDVATVEDMQQFQLEFDARKDKICKNVDFSLEYAIVCLTEELGELARCIKKMRRAEANGNLDLALDWKNKMNGEMADLFIYLIKVANKQGVRLDALYYQKMRENHEELDCGGGKFLGHEGKEHRDVEITRN